jgi:hypothetical protein
MNASSQFSFMGVQYNTRFSWDSAGSTAVVHDSWSKLAAPHHELEGLGDFAFLMIESVEDLAQLVPPPIDLEAEKQSHAGAEHQWHNGDLFVHG